MCLIQIYTVTHCAAIMGQVWSKWLEFLLVSRLWHLCSLQWLWFFVAPTDFGCKLQPRQMIYIRFGGASTKYPSTAFGPWPLPTNDMRVANILEIFRFPDTHPSKLKMNVTANNMWCIRSGVYCARNHQSQLALAWMDMDIIGRMEMKKCRTFNRNIWSVDNFIINSEESNTKKRYIKFAHDGIRSQWWAQAKKIPIGNQLICVCIWQFHFTNCEKFNSPIYPMANDNSFLVMRKIMTEP